MRFTKFIKEVSIFEENKVADWQRYINDLPELKASIDILNKLEELGGKAYIVGGAVRDIVLGVKEPNDIDIATNVPLDKILDDKEFSVHNIGNSVDFGIIAVNYKGFTFEIAQFRTETYEKPKTVRKIIK